MILRKQPRRSNHIVTIDRDARSSRHSPSAGVVGRDRCHHRREFLIMGMTEHAPAGDNQSHITEITSGESSRWSGMTTQCHRECQSGNLRISFAISSGNGQPARIIMTELSRLEQMGSLNIIVNQFVVMMVSVRSSRVYKSMHFCQP